MNINPDQLARLRIERASDVAAETARAAAAAAAEAAGIAMAKEMGQRMAVEMLPWHRVAALAAERLIVNEPRHYSAWPDRSGYLAPEISVRSRDQWVAFLDGVSDVAALVEPPTC